VKKFWHRIEAAFKKLFGSSNWEKTASAVITYAAPIIETIVSLAAGGPAEVLVARVVSTIQGDLATMSAVVDGATGTPPANELQVFVNAANSIKSNLTSILASAEVKNSAKQAAITAAVDTIVGELDACVANMPAIAAAPAK
jgi:hypothetical protein